MFQKLNYGIQLSVTNKKNDACVHVVPELRLRIGWSCFTMLSWSHNSAHSGVWALRLALTLPVYCMSRFYFLMAATTFAGREVAAESRTCILNFTFSIILHCMHVAYFKTTITFFPNLPSPQSMRATDFPFLSSLMRFAAVHTYPIIYFVMWYNLLLSYAGNSPYRAICSHCYKEAYGIISTDHITRNIHCKYI